MWWFNHHQYVFVRRFCYCWRLKAASSYRTKLRHQTQRCSGRIRKEFLLNLLGKKPTLSDRISAAIILLSLFGRGFGNTFFLIVRRACPVSVTVCGVYCSFKITLILCITHNERRGSRLQTLLCSHLKALRAATQPNQQSSTSGLYQMVPWRNDLNSILLLV